MAATAIVFLHASQNLQGALTLDSQFTGALSLFVDLFFTISGFVIAFLYFDKLSDFRTYAVFLLRRVARLGPLLWATLAAFAFLGAVGTARGVHMNHPQIFDMRCFLPNIFFLQATSLCNHLSFNGPAWSISAEFVLYLSAPLFFFLARRSTILLGGLAALWFVSITIYAHGSAWLGWLVPGGPFRAVPSFCLGICLFRLRENLVLRRGEIWMWISLAVFLIGAALHANWFILLPILYIAVAFGICADGSGSASRLVRLGAAGGQLTYSSYMLHDLILLGVVTIVGNHLLHLSGMHINFSRALCFRHYTGRRPTSVGIFSNDRCAS